MVDATDGLTLESAMSAATTIKIYGTLNNNSGVFFVISGTGSLAAAGRDIQHVGASATGIYHIALGNAQLSDSSNAYYDGYCIHLSAAGAARQTILASGVRATTSDILSTLGSQFAILSNYLSNASNYLSNISAMLSDVDSALSSQFVNQSNFFSYLSNINSYLSHMESNLSGIVSNTYSLLSDTLSTMNSQFLVTSNYLSNISGAISDIDSALTSQFTMQSDSLSNINSMLTAGTFLLGASNLSDIGSRVWLDFEARTGSTVSDLYSTLTAGGGGASTSAIAAKVWSDFQSQVGRTVSDTYSALLAGGGGATASAIAAKVWSDFGSQVGRTVSDAFSELFALSDAISNVYSLLSDTRSTMDSQFAVTSNYLSNASNYLSNISGTLSDVDSALTSQFTYTSNLLSYLSNVASNMSGVVSDIRSGTQVLQSAFIGHTGSTASTVTSPSALEIDGIAHDSQFNGYYVRLLGGSQVDELRLVVNTILASSQLIVQPPFNSRVLSGVDYVLLPGNPWQSRLHSDLRSYLGVMSGVLSDTYSLLSDTRSTMDSQFLVTSNYLSNLSAILSDVDSALTSQFLLESDMLSHVNSMLITGTFTLGASNLSDISSRVWSDFESRVGRTVSDTFSELFALSDGISNVYSAVLLAQSLASDAASGVSDLRSLLTTTGVLLTSDAMSDIGVAVWANATGAQVNSRLLVNQSAVSNLSAILSDFYSDFQSRVPKLVATDSRLSSDLSDLRSAIAAMTFTLGASDMSDLTSAVWAHPVGARVDSRVRLVQSDTSDLYSLLTAFDARAASDLSNIYSSVDLLRTAIIYGTGTTTSVVANSQALKIAGIGHDSQLNGYFIRLLGGSQLDEIRLIWDTTLATSQLWVKPAFNSIIASGVPYIIFVGEPYFGVLVSDVSDIASAVWAAVATTHGVTAGRMGSALRAAQSHASDAHSAVLLVQSRLSDFDSRVISDFSDVRSALALLAGVTSDFYSDFQSRVPKLVATDSRMASDLSDIRSAIGAITVTLGASDVSDIASAVLAGIQGITPSDISNIASAVWAHGVGTRVDSRVLLVQSRLSDFDSRMVSDVSDLRSAIAAITVTIDASAASDIASAVWGHLIGARVDSRLLLTQSRVSDTYSLLSDFYSDFQSRVPKLVATDSRLSSDLSDLRSAIAAITVAIDASAASDIASAVWGHATGVQVNSRLLINQSRVSDIYSLLSDTFSTMNSQFAVVSNYLSNASNYLSNLSGFASDILSAARGNSDALSDVLSRLNSASFLSDVASHVWAAKYTGNSGPSTFGSLLSDISSRVLLVQSRLSDFDSRMVSDVSDIRSAIAAITATVSASDISDIASAVWANVIGARVDSRLRLVQSDTSDTLSKLVVMSDILSNVNSLLVAGTFALGASNLSDIGSRVWLDFEARTGSTVSDLFSTLTAGGAGATPSAIANKVWSDFQSRTGSTVSDMFSTLAAGGGGATPSAIADKVWSDFASKVGRTVSDAFSELFALSDATSNVYSLLSDFYSDFQSRVPVAVATGAQLSDLHSDLRSYLAVMSNVLSDVYSLLSDTRSTTDSQFLVVSNYLSNLSAFVSNVDSALTSQFTYVSTIISGINLMLTAGTFALGASNLSDISTRVWSDFASKVGSTVSDLYSTLAVGGGATTSAIAAQVWSDFTSRVGRNISDAFSELFALSDATSAVYALLSDLSSDFQSRVPGVVATGAQLSDVQSDLRSGFADMTDTLSLLTTITQDTYSLLSDVASDVTVMSGVQSNIYSLLSDVASDFQSRVPAGVATATQLATAYSDLRSVLDTAGTTQNTIYTLLSDVSSDVSIMFGNVATTQAAVSDLRSVVLGGVTLTQAGARAAADEFLQRDLSGGSSGTSRRVQNALRALRNRNWINAGRYYVFEENDTTVAWSGAVSTAAGNPIVNMDP